MQQQRRPDPGNVGGIRLAAVERHGGGEFGQTNGEGVGDPAAVTKTDHADLAVGARVRHQMPERGDEVFRQLALVELPLHRPAFVVGAGIPAERRQAVRGQGREPGDGDAAGDILDIGIEAAVLVNDDDTAALGLRRGGADQVSANGAVALGRSVGDELPLYAPVAFLDLLGERVPRRQGIEEGRGGDPADGEFRGLIEKHPAFDQPMGVTVVEIE